jgi:hypothetical protein
MQQVSYASTIEVRKETPIDVFVNGLIWPEINEARKRVVRFPNGSYRYFPSVAYQQYIKKTACKPIYQRVY